LEKSNTMPDMTTSANEIEKIYDIAPVADQLSTSELLRTRRASANQEDNKTTSYCEVSVLLFDRSRTEMSMPAHLTA
jgi:hypothetical protein